jgi:hypothetical protein
MDVIREHLMYKNSTLNICMKLLTPQEQYEIIRILHESKTTVTVCSHNSTNQYIDILLKKMNITLKSCETEFSGLQVFGLQD